MIIRGINIYYAIQRNDSRWEVSTLREYWENMHWIGKHVYCDFGISLISIFKGVVSSYFHILIFIYFYQYSVQMIYIVCPIINYCLNGNSSITMCYSFDLRCLTTPPPPPPPSLPSKDPPKKTKGIWLSSSYNYFKVTSYPV